MLCIHKAKFLEAEKIFAGIAYMNSKYHKVPPAALINLLAICLESDDAKSLYYKNIAMDIKLKQIRSTFDTAVYHHIIEDMLAAKVKAGPAVASAFSSMVLGEAKFLQQFMPFASNEERITGFLLASLVSALAPSRRPYVRGDMNSASRDNFTFGIFDTANDSNEKTTGADVGIIVRSGPDSNRIVKAARIQVKIGVRVPSGVHQFKVANTVPLKLKTKIDNIIRKNSEIGAVEADELRDKEFEKLKFQQLRQLTSHENLGYYLVINKSTERPTKECGYMPPIVLRADAVKKLHLQGQLQTTADHLDPRFSPIALSAFIGLGLTASKGGWGVNIDKGSDNDSEGSVVEKAVDMLFSGANAPTFGLFVDVSSEPFPYARWLSLAGRVRPTHISASESPWVNFDTTGDPELPGDWSPPDVIDPSPRP